MTYNAGSAVATYSLDTKQFDAAVRNAIRSYQQLKQAQDAALSRASLPAAGGGGGGGGDRAAAQAAAEQQRLATETARTAQVTNQAAVSAQRLATEEQRTAAATAQAAAAQSRAEAAALRLAKAQDQTATASQRGAKFAEQLGQAYTTSLTSIVGPAAIAAASLAAVGKAGELVQLGAQAEQARGAFDQLATSAGTTGQALLQALRAASAGTISDLNLELAANRANLLGVADSAAELAPLMEIARDRAQKMGISTTQAFNDLITGLGRGSALILDNLGITVSVTEANEAYARSLGKTVAQLTEAEQKQALINAVLTQGKASLETTGGAAETTAAKLERLNAAGDNIKAGFGAALASEIGPTADLLGRLGAEAAAAGDGAQAGGAGAITFGRSVAEATPIVGQLLGSIREMSEDMNQLAASSADVGAAVASAPNAFNAATAAIQANGQATSFTISAIDQQIALEAQRRGEMLAGADAAAAQARLLEQSANASLLDTQAKELLTLQTQLLNEQAMVTAQAFLAANPGITEAGIRAQIAAGLIPQMTGELAILTQQIRIAKAELGGIAMGRPETGGDAIARSLNNAAASQRYLTAQTERAAEAQKQQILQTGTHSQKVQILQKDYERLARIYGKGSAEAIEAETKLIQARNTGGRSAGGAGAARLKQQQNVNNQIFDAELKAQQKLEDLTRDHEQKVLDIEKEFQKKSLEQQQKNDVDKRTSRASFYKNLNVDNRQLAESVRNELAAAYEAAYAKAQELAAAGNAQQANEYLKLKQAQLQAETQFQRDLADARASGDKALVEALIQARELERQAEAEQEKQVLEGGDANVNARNEQLNEEQRRFEEAQGKAVEASDRATDRIVTNAERRGLALDTENQKLRDQQALYDGLGGRTGAPAGGVPTTPPPSGAPGGAVPIAQPSGAEVWRVFDTALLDATNAQTERLAGELATLRASVDALAPRIAAVESAVRSSGTPRYLD